MSQKPIKVLEIIDMDNVNTRFFVLLNDERTKFTLYVASDEAMSNDDIIELLGLFCDERRGSPLDGSDFGDQTH